MSITSNADLMERFQKSRIVLRLLVVGRKYLELYVPVQLKREVLYSTRNLLFCHALVSQVPVYFDIL